MRRTVVIAALGLVGAALLFAGFAGARGLGASATCVPHTGMHCKTTSTSTTGATTTTSGGDINQNSTWNCTSTMTGQNVTVTNPSGDAVVLRAGCTGSIGKITIRQWHGDGLKIDAASNLTIASVDIRCYAHDVGKHQDGVQILGGGNNVQIDGGYVGCYSANNSQVWINPAGQGGGNGAVNVVFHNVTFDPAGVDSGQPLNTYGPGGAYGLANQTSTDSGFADSQLISNPNHHPCVTGSGAVNPVWTADTFPAGDSCP